MEYQHADERILAAQFSRLKLDFVKERTAQIGQSKDILLDRMLDLGLAGIKGAPHAVGETPRISAVLCEEVLNEDDEQTKEGMELFEKLKAASDKRALLIGGSEKSLKGVKNDLRIMADLLLSRGFSLSLFYGADATRENIIAAWLQRIEQTPTGSEHAVVVYYSGHGGTNSSTEYIQYIIPTNTEKTSATDLCGILDIGLSYLVNALTD